ncbi:RagB/SusD family nutrient uptake outer membrane protein [Pedobacter frigidisoli]|uniref:RagB/SusD family nutrient uptake outer membrane protein n=1 Tax=Pedobacter frigidisoli TaxID=2530455 RepID=UPI0029303C16|nr:RagB/SusD family nutrient uptake outer membrane protein [Pedobacter frigidisoli]
MKYKKTLYILFTATVLVSGCTKDYEKMPKEYVSDQYAFDVTDPNGTQAELFLAGIYAQMPLGYNRIGSGISGNRLALNDEGGTPLDASADDGVSTIQNTAGERVSLSGYTPFYNPDDCWGNSYGGIRLANIFLANYNKIPWAQANKRQYYGAEARFLRAFFYFELVKRYGGVILVGDQVFSLNDNLDLPRSSYDQCVTYLVSELDAIKDLLRPDQFGAGGGGNSDIGRISKGAAYALKAKILLYSASPQNNANNDPARWEAAANAAKAVMTLGTFQLESDVRNVFTTLNNREMIFYKIHGLTSGTTATVQTNALEYALSPVGYTVANTISRGRVSPSQELVDAFPTSRGLPISTDLKSASNTNGFDANNPYANRDPRLTLTVFFNGQTWQNRAVETFVNGRDNMSSDAVKTRTGYYQRKFLGNFASGSTYGNSYRPWSYIRYAEILLDFAEARNEFSGPDTEINNALVLLRARAGIPATTAGTATSVAVLNYGIPTVSAGVTKDQMRIFIRNERRIELAFEEQRYWDLRRWKIAEAVYNSGVSGMSIVKNSNGTLTYTKVPVVTPFFQARMYLYPIPYNQVASGKNLSQNPGW